ncbi:hypothetical protein NONI108955_01325 [Nocardia ninae]|uniref:Uncharacterized protein n=1 Tax=Nocardia ninae NBRC 108245 TaxID=1210091 RepID=A0A511MC66_9NOCA|nr:hypothetical protein [Nocardia ninae]GEM38220.1 hypothetical protein NN4_27390 [Nocardia ninae NBRC 108245]
MTDAAVRTVTATIDNSYVPAGSNTMTYLVDEVVIPIASSTDACDHGITICAECTDSWAIDYTITGRLPWDTTVAVGDLLPFDRWHEGDRRVKRVFPDPQRPGPVLVLFTDHTWVEEAADLRIDRTTAPAPPEPEFELVPSPEVIVAAMSIVDERGLDGLGEFKREDWLEARRRATGGGQVSS